MPIFDQGYQHWQGTLHSRIWRSWAIARRGAVQASKGRFTRIALIGAIMPSLGLATILALWGMVERQASWADAFLKTFGLPETIFSDQSRLRVVVWTFAFHFFLIFEFYAAMIVVLLAGPELISQDLRFNAVPLYFSKPLTRFDYFLGKLGVIGLLLSAVVFVPLIVAYLLGIAFSLDARVVKDTFPVLLGALYYGMVIVASAGMLMLAVSSLSRNTLTVGAIWMGFIMISFGVGAVSHGVSRNDRTLAISYPNNLMRIGRELLGVPSAASEFLNVYDEVQEQTQKMSGAARGPFGLPMPVPPAAKEKKDRRAERDRQRADPSSRNRESGLVIYARDLALDPHPLGLAVAALGGLFAASVLVLSSRVKSLDRLK